MFYIPEKMYRHIENEDAVQAILEKYYGPEPPSRSPAEIRTACENELIALDEDKIAKNLGIILA